MGIWIFMVIMDMIMPIIMIVFGNLFMKRPPSTINNAYGYRTKQSMKSVEAWTFAHKYFGRIWLISGLILIPVSVIPMVFVLNKESRTIGIVGSLIEFVQLFALIIAILPTELALSKQFDSEGKPR